MVPAVVLLGATAAWSCSGSDVPVAARHQAFGAPASSAPGDASNARGRPAPLADGGADAGNPHAGRPSTASTRPVFHAGFLAIDGTTFTDDKGTPVRLAGLNIYNAANRGGCWDALGNDNGLDEALTEIEASGTGGNVFRVYFFQKFAIDPVSQNLRDWRAFDNVIALAKKHHQRIIPVIDNHWAATCNNGAEKDLGWYRGDYKSKVQPGDLETYRDYAISVTGRYAKEPTVAAWMLMNEAEASDVVDGKRYCSPSPSFTDGTTDVRAAALHGFTSDMVAAVKAVDGIHPVTLGTLGANQCPYSDSHANADGSTVSNFQWIHDDTGVDYCDFHIYKYTSPFFQQRADECIKTLHKPIVIGEMSIATCNENVSTDCISTEQRATDFQQTLPFLKTAGAAGVLLWAWRQSSPSSDGYEYQANDPSLPLVGEFLK